MTYFLADPHKIGYPGNLGCEIVFHLPGSFLSIWHACLVYKAVYNQKISLPQGFADIFYREPHLKLSSECLHFFKLVSAYLRWSLSPQWNLQITGEEINNTILQWLHVAYAEITVWCKEERVVKSDQSSHIFINVLAIVAYCRIVL